MLNLMLNNFKIQILYEKVIDLCNIKFVWQHTKYDFLQINIFFYMTYYLRSKFFYEFLTIKHDFSSTASHFLHYLAE
jgi:hypothetical protein